MPHHNHITLLVRLWLANETDTQLAPSVAPNSSARTLRITALDPHTGERWGFATLEELLAFFQQLLDASGQ